MMSKIAMPKAKKEKKGKKKFDFAKLGLEKGREKMAKTPLVAKPMKPKKKKAPSPGMK